MAMGERNFAFYSSGSTGSNAAGTHNLFGNISSLSLLNQDEVVFVQISASAADIRLSGTVASPATNNTGLRITISASNYDLPPMRVGDASQITFAREAGNNASPLWTIWFRRP